MNAKQATCILVIMAAVCTPAMASDAYVIRFNAPGRSNGALTTIWSDDIIFYNQNSNEVMVRALGVSNGSGQGDAPVLTLPPGQAISLNAVPSVNTAWKPVPVPSVWVLHLDVPAGVLLESRDECYLSFASSELFPAPRAKVSLPVFHDLQAAGQAQVHLGTDLSGNESRINVAIYNAGTAPATAQIEVRRVCDGTATDTRTIVVPPNTIVQTNGLSVGDPSNCPAGSSLPYERYTIVTVSQPSITVVSNLNESLPGTGPEFGTGIAPIIGLGVAKTEKF